MVRPQSLADQPRYGASQHDAASVADKLFASWLPRAGSPDADYLEEQGSRAIPAGTGPSSAGS